MEKPTYERVLFSGIAKEMRQFTLYLPLYNALSALELGFSRGARFAPIDPPAIRKPVVFYGTSITQGGCAGTPGADYVSTLGRLLNLDVLNLGFSGNGKCDPELAELMGEIDAAMYVFCSCANTPLAELPRKLPVFYRILRRLRPRTPIVLLSRTRYTYEQCDPVQFANFEGYRDTMIHLYSKLRRAGDANVHFVDGGALLPGDMAGVHVDGGHPTDLGFAVMAERLAPFIQRILGL
jgi:lysophospholipase L1-like esterase